MATKTVVNNGIFQLPSSTGFSAAPSPRKRLSGGGCKGTISGEGLRAPGMDLRWMVKIEEAYGGARLWYHVSCHCNKNNTKYMYIYIIHLPILVMIDFQIDFFDTFENLKIWQKCHWKSPKGSVVFCMGGAVIMGGKRRNNQNLAKGKQMGSFLLLVVHGLILHRYSQAYNIYIYRVYIYIC